MKVTVLAGGVSAEREVSLNSATCVAQALEKGGHQATVLDPGAGWSVIDPAAAPKESSRANSGLPGPEGIAVLKGGDLVINVLHGGQGEDGTLQAVLELLEVPYAGSRPAACAAAMDKVMAKRLFAAADVPTPDYLALSGDRKDGWRTRLEPFLKKIGYPVIVKPAGEGSTVGLTKAGDFDQALAAVELAAGLSAQVLVEEFIEGRELTVGVLDSEALPVLEVVVPGGFYDYEAKYRSHENRYICPAEIEQPVAERARRLALAAFEVLGLQDFARIDFRLDPRGGLWCLEANNQPGMTDSSLLPKAARVIGLDLTGLLERIIKNVQARYSRNR